MIFTLPIKIAIGVGATGAMAATGTTAAWALGVFEPAKPSTPTPRPGDVPAVKTYKYVYGATEETTDQLSEEIVMETTSDKTKNYQCKMGGQPFACTITKPTLSAAQKSGHIATFSKEDTTSTIAQSELKEAHKIYKIMAESTHLEGWEPSKKIEIISTKTGETKKYASIKPAFETTKTEVKSGSATTITETSPKGTTEYFIGKAAGVDDSITPTPQCSYLEDTTKTDCKIYGFATGANTELNSLTFEGLNGTPTTATEQWKYYLIEATGNSKEIGSPHKSITITKDANTTKITDIQSVALLGDKKYMFIF